MGVTEPDFADAAEAQAGVELALECLESEAAAVVVGVEGVDELARITNGRGEKPGAGGFQGLVPFREDGGEVAEAENAFPFRA